MVTTILQISDLHRNPTNPIRNGPLLTSLLQDAEKFVADAVTSIPRPELIFVTGDIIQGVKPGTTDFETALAVQYEEAVDFLDGLANRFVGGDRERVIVIPGNHDVSACHAQASFARLDIPDDRWGGVVQQLFSPGSNYRWDWKSRSAVEIGDHELYNLRLDAFAKFYEDFYHGKRSYSLDPAKQFDVFDFPDFNLTVVGFSSCHNNDILNKAGMIHPECIASASQLLREPEFHGRTKIALWHHNTEGSPQKADYMDSGALQNLLQGGFVLGFHGHQHRPQYIDERSKYGGNERMTVVSAGTLCGSASPRYGRSYNVVEIDNENSSGMLHLREMVNDDVTFPIWGRRSFPPSDMHCMKFQYSPTEVPEFQVDATVEQLLDAQQALIDGDVLGAIKFAGPLLGKHDIARKILIECHTDQENHAELVKIIGVPENPTEIIALMDAFWILGDKRSLGQLLESEVVVNCDYLAVAELRATFIAKLGSK